MLQFSTLHASFYSFILYLLLHENIALCFFLPLDRGIKECIDNLNERLEVIDDQLDIFGGRLQIIDNRLDTLGDRLDIIDSQLDILVEILQQQCNNASVGSFHNPAHNCSHIARAHPNATSGI